MSALHLVPGFIIDGIEAMAQRGVDPQAVPLLLELRRWQAHACHNPSLVPALIEQMKRAGDQLAGAIRILEGIDLQDVGKGGLDVVHAGETARQVERAVAASQASPPVASVVQMQRPTPLVFTGPPQPQAFQPVMPGAFTDTPGSTPQPPALPPAAAGRDSQQKL